MTQRLELNFGDIVRRQDLPDAVEAVVIQLQPTISVADIITDDEGEYLGTNVGTLGGPVEIVGRWAVGQVVRGIVKGWSFMGEELPLITDHLEEQSRMKPVEYKNPGQD